MRRLIRPAVAAGLFLLIGGLFSGDAGALTPAQCEYFETGGQTAICHATKSARQPYMWLNLSATACAVGHTGHARDYIAFDDPTCNGQGSFPEGAPCDGSVECADGLSCVAEICTAPLPLRIH